MGSDAAVLVVGHDASRSGAPTVALSWLRWARRERPEQLAVVLAAGGPLLRELRLTAPTTVAPRRATVAAEGRWASMLPGPLADGAATAARWLSRPAHPEAASPVVVANTTAAWALAATVRRRRRLVLWAHELDGTVSRIVSDAQRRRLLAVTDHVVAVGPAVATMVVERWGVAADDVSVVPSFVDDDPSPAGGGHDLVAVGSLHPRKGPDLFVAVAAQVARRRGGVGAAWVGGPLDGPTAELVRHDVAAAGLGPAVDLVGEVDDVAAFLPADGVLVHVAREDPAPLVVLEAARCGVPVVSWAGSGAAEVAVAAGRADLTVAPGDVAAMAGRVAALLDDPVERRRAGRDLALAAAHRTTSAVAPRLHRAFVGPGS